MIDLYGLVIPAEALPGEHVLRVGMYGLDDGQRLPVTLDGGVVPNAEIGDAIDLTRVTIREKK